MNMGKTITSRLPDKMVEEIERIAKLENLDRSSVVRRLLNKAIPEWKLEYALKLYQHKEISLGKAAELSSLSIWEMLEKLAQNRIPLNYDLEELKSDLEKVKEL
jgi:predicted HTH domain antitoxin